MQYDRQQFRMNTIRKALDADVFAFDHQLIFYPIGKYVRLFDMILVTGIWYHVICHNKQLCDFSSLYLLSPWEVLFVSKCNQNQSHGRMENFGKVAALLNKHFLPVDWSVSLEEIKWVWTWNDLHSPWLEGENWFRCFAIPLPTSVLFELRI